MGKIVRLDGTVIADDPGRFSASLIEDAVRMGDDLSRIEVVSENLEGLNLSSAQFRGAHFTEVKFAETKLCWAKLDNAVFEGCNFTDTDMDYMCARGVKFSHSWMTHTSLVDANLTGAKFEDVNMTYANLRRATMTNARLNDVRLEQTDMREVDLSGVQGLLSASDWMRDNFHKIDEGYIVYKVFGSVYNPSKSWKIEEGSVIEEVVNSHRCIECGCGINFGTLEFVREMRQDLPIWECLLSWEDLADLVVPYTTTGKARCGKLTVLRDIDGG